MEKRLHALEERRDVSEEHSRYMEAEMQTLQQEDLTGLDSRVSGIGKRLGDAFSTNEVLEARCHSFHVSLTQEASERKAGIARVEAVLVNLAAQRAEDEHRLRASVSEQVSAAVADLQDSTKEELQRLSKAFSEASLSMRAMVSEVNVAKEMAPRLAKLEMVEVLRAPGTQCAVIDTTGAEVARLASLEERMGGAERHTETTGQQLTSCTGALEEFQAQCQAQGALMQQRLLELGEQVEALRAPLRLGATATDSVAASPIVRVRPGAFLGPEFDADSDPSLWILRFEDEGSRTPSVASISRLSVDSNGC